MPTPTLTAVFQPEFSTGSPQPTSLERIAKSETTIAETISLRSNTAMFSRAPMLKKKNGARNSLIENTRARRFQRGEYSANASPAKNGARNSLIENTRARRFQRGEY